MKNLKICKHDIISDQPNEGSSGYCKKIRRRFSYTFGKYFSINAPWLQRHIAKCPRCQRRLASVGRVHLALSFIKSQSHSLDLLMNANKQTINVLKHSLREAPKAQKLKIARPDIKPAQRLIQCFRPSANLAACILVLFLMKFGIFSSMESARTKGQKAYKQYYIDRIGEELTDDIFPGDVS